MEQSTTKSSLERRITAGLLQAAKARGLVTQWEFQRLMELRRRR